MSLTGGEMRTKSKLFIFVIVLFSIGFILQYLSVNNKMPTKMTRLGEIIDFSETAKIEINTRYLTGDKPNELRTIEQEQAVQQFVQYWDKREVKRASNTRSGRLEGHYYLINYFNDKDQLVASIKIVGEHLIKLDYPTYSYIHVVTSGLEINFN